MALGGSCSIARCGARIRCWHTVPICCNDTRASAPPRRGAPDGQADVGAPLRRHDACQQPQPQPRTRTKVGTRTQRRTSRSSLADEPSRQYGLLARGDELDCRKAAVVVLHELRQEPVGVFHRRRIPQTQLLHQTALECQESPFHASLACGGRAQMMSMSM